MNEISLNIPFFLFARLFFCLCFSIVSASRPLFLLPKCVVPEKKEAKDSRKKRAELLLLKQIEGKERNWKRFFAMKIKNNIFLVIV